MTDKPDVHTRVKAVKARLLSIAKAERKINQEITDAAGNISDRASAVSNQLRKAHERDGDDLGRDTAYQSILLSRNIAETVLGSARDLKRRIDSIDGGVN